MFKDVQDHWPNIDIFHSHWINLDKFEFYLNPKREELIAQANDFIKSTDGYSIGFIKDSNTFIFTHKNI